MPSPVRPSHDSADYPLLEADAVVDLEDLENLQLLQIVQEDDDFEEDALTVSMNVGDFASSDSVSSVDDSPGVDVHEPVLPLRREAMISSPPVSSTAIGMSLGHSTHGALGEVDPSVGVPTESPSVPSDLIDISVELVPGVLSSGVSPDAVLDVSVDAVPDAVVGGPNTAVFEASPNEIGLRLEPAFPFVDQQAGLRVQDFAAYNNVAPLISTGMRGGMARAQLELDDWEKVRLRQQRKRKAITFSVVFVVIAMIGALLVYALIQSQRSESPLMLEPVALGPTDTTNVQQGEKGSQYTTVNNEDEPNNRATTAWSDASSRGRDAATGPHDGASSDVSVFVGAKETLVTVTGPPNGVVYVGGRPVGRTSIAFTMDCGFKFLRVGQPSTTAGVTRVKWLAPGRMVDFPCGKDFSVPASKVSDPSQLFAPSKPVP